MPSLNNKNIISNNIKKSMVRKEISRNRLVNDLTLKCTAVSDWINGKTYPRIDKIEILANYFEVKKTTLVELTSETIIPTPKIFRVPLLGKVFCGEPILVRKKLENIIDESVNYLPSEICFYLK